MVHMEENFWCWRRRFFTIICNPSNKGDIKNALIKHNLRPHSVSISENGSESWTEF